MNYLLDCFYKIINNSNGMRKIKVQIQLNQLNVKLSYKMTNIKISKLSLSVPTFFDSESYLGETLSLLLKEESRQPTSLQLLFSQQRY